jgi:hypothetical protein
MLWNKSSKELRGFGYDATFIPASTLLLMLIMKSFKNNTHWNNFFTRNLNNLNLVVIFVYSKNFELLSSKLGSWVGAVQKLCGPATLEENFKMFKKSIGHFIFSIEAPLVTIQYLIRTSPRRASLQ